MFNDVKILLNFCLGQEVLKHIFVTNHVTEPYLSAHVRDGVVTLDGGVLSRIDMELCEHLAREVPGVQKVVNNTSFIYASGIA